MDSFAFGDLANNSSNLDRITDFKVIENRLIVLVPLSNSLVFSPITAEQLVIGTAATETDDRFIYNNSTGTLFFDEDGSDSMAKIAVVKLDADLSLTANNILTI